MKEIESLLEEVINSNSVIKFNQLLQYLFNKWLYFFVIDSNINDNVKNVIYIHLADNENPINIPTIKTNDSNIGVLYTNKQKAIDSVEIPCKIGQLKGIKAFEMFSEIKEIDTIAIQGHCGNIQISKVEIMRLLKNT
ncbi:MAG: hypothetical protein ACN4GM_05530 [Gammaproteobacteria bacterium]